MLANESNFFVNAIKLFPKTMSQETCAIWLISFMETLDLSTDLQMLQTEEQEFQFKNPPAKNIFIKAVKEAIA